MSLKTRLLGLAAALMIIASVASWLAYRELSDDIIERWGQQVAEIQVRYDSARLLQSLEREIGLARQMADSSTLVNWATSCAISASRIWDSAACRFSIPIERFETVFTNLF